MTDLSDRGCRFTNAEDRLIHHTHPWRLLPDGQAVRTSAGIPDGSPRALSYYLPAASVNRGRDREYQIDVPETLGPNGSVIRLAVRDSGLWSLINTETGLAVEMDGKSEVKHTLKVPGCKTMTPTEYGYLCTEADRLWEVDRDGKVIWESWWGTPGWEKKLYGHYWEVRPFVDVRPCFRKVTVGIHPAR